MAIKSIVFFGVTLLLLSSCYVNLRRLDRHVTASLSGMPKIDHVNFTDFEFDQLAFEKVFPKEFEEQLITSLRVNSVDVVNENPEFEILLENLYIEIGSKKEEVKDVNASNYGATFELQQIELCMRGSIVQVSSGQTSSWIAKVDARESLEKQTNTETSALGVQSTTVTYQKKQLTPDVLETLLNTLALRSQTAIVKDLISAVNEK